MVTVKVRNISFDPGFCGSKPQGTVTVSANIQSDDGPVGELVGIQGGVVSGVINLESPDVEASGRRPRHEEHYHEA